ncbi:DUF1772 domain-containing protein [Oscillatoria sp. FACHB-1407]|uniref:anthrone oxygenase family protein n=1 Tax=Oscillatoria sp. FACHB-1407 TaxID=2692847 RepID=UPI001681C800|nr:anthrone oxygenase family protein [Oscillatoria sp. FACHB-1407]MBD2465273.1 DUF1772 domain-containing protein [Oscillatoria sp. FACHB-1407]
MVGIEYLYVLKLLTALGCGLIAGVFFAFSTFVMKALAQQPPAQGIAAMQAINITVINPWFMTAFLGTSVVCLILMISSLLRWQQPGAAYLLVSALFYLVGCFGVTMVFNVPLNDALANVNPDTSEGATLWARYLTYWTFWNHVRAIAAFITAVLFTMALNAPSKL